MELKESQIREALLRESKANKKYVDELMQQLNNKKLLIDLKKEVIVNNTHLEKANNKMKADTKK